MSVRLAAGESLGRAKVGEVVPSSPATAGGHAWSGVPAGDLFFLFAGVDESLSVGALRGRNGPGDALERHDSLQ
jgi:hypothetical protein